MRICITSDNRFLLTFDATGRAFLVNLITKVVLNHISFKGPINDAKFSPNNELLAINHGRKLSIYKIDTRIREYNPFQLVKEFINHNDDITCINWSKDGKYIITGSLDLTVKMFSVKDIKGYRIFTLAGHKNKIINAYFDQTHRKIFTISYDGYVFEWVWETKNDEGEEEEEGEEIEENLKNEIYLISQGKWKCINRHCVGGPEKAKITSACISSTLLCVGLSSGVFSLFSLEDMSLIHSLSISKNVINTVDINSSGEWIAFGSQQLSQLLVWEWKSETHILKQQGHFYDIRTVYIIIFLDYLFTRWFINCYWW